MLTCRLSLKFEINSQHERKFEFNEAVGEFMNIPLVQDDMGEDAIVKVTSDLCFHRSYDRQGYFRS